jgi:hypothetical protein
MYILLHIVRMQTNDSPFLPFLAFPCCLRFILYDPGDETKEKDLE